MNRHIIRAALGASTIELIEGDITEQDTDAIVNAANGTLLGGGGVDGAIHRAAGPELVVETQALGGCRTGDAKISRGYRLKARHVIHAVGPVYRPADADVARMLASAYRRSLEVAVSNGIETIAFPSISTGVYGYPLEEAAPIAIETILDFLAAGGRLELVRFVLYNREAYDAFVNVLHALALDRPELQLAP